MARSDPGLVCMLCASAPCECNIAPKKATPKLPKPKPETTPAQESPKPPAPPVAKATPVQARRVGLLNTSHVQQSVLQRQTDDIQERAALTILARSGLLGYEELERIRQHLNMSSVEVDILIFKDKRQRAGHS